MSLEAERPEGSLISSNTGFLQEALLSREPQLPIVIHQFTQAKRCPGTALHERTPSTLRRPLPMQQCQT